MQLMALLVTDAELWSLTLEDAKRALAWRESGIVELPSVSSIVAALETIRIQLEGDRGGSRFPGIWNLAIPLVEDSVSGWGTGYFDHLLAEIATIESELEALPIGRAATVWLGSEGFPEIYGRESPCYEAKYGQEERGRNLRTWFADPVNAIKAVCLHGKGTGNAVALVREGGVPVLYLWNFGTPADKPMR